ncbi:hypothetical protein Fmac_030763 [Flemingia macrophylla]|uniref:RIN4 pathogenic type III effector avirulence factor Avr cleavage site domain-containing protein n=1 Tax=Flemingia macrophylla TaxID=520843 RepID=A0ABD1L038_9FABA
MISVPQFGGWDQNSPEANNYTVMFTKARAMKKHQKNCLIEIRHINLDEGNFANANNHGEAHHVISHGYARHGSSHSQLVITMQGKKRILTYINCCIRP